MHTTDTELNTFLQKYSSELSSKVNTSRIKVEILNTTQEDLKKAGEKIQAGSLVAFPTETVYGLGANALDEQAVKSIFVTKGRPLTDPIIVHVSCVEDAIKITDTDEEIRELFQYLTEAFWPGPLTCVLKADLTKIPLIVTAGTGYVGLRQPKTQIAQDLIKLSQRPIAAPSANLFSHVSPTSAIHVFNDFFDKDVSIIEGPRCEFGIESTVAKLIKDENGCRILVLRAGSLSDKALKEALLKSERFKDVPVLKVKTETHVSEEINSEAPGMLLKHYSPYIETYLVEVVQTLPQSPFQEVEINPKETVLIDYGKTLKNISQDYLKYFSLTDDGNLREAMSHLYSILRAAENVSGAQQILILNLSTYYASNQNPVNELPEYLETVYDKSFRSASGKKIKYHSESKKFFREM